MSLLLLPPRCTLFPYTTLFRSRSLRRPSDGEEGVDGEGQAEAEVQGARLLPVPAVRPQSRDAPEVDRKSTRLNSSHTVISYAVFCLKKKSCSRSRYGCS